ncbi:hypothetical protein SA2016_0673 [Sinomonas atrocyanea]|uniref:Uncharacterized protein n=1 Tax=Sinomonas atrocyanea TaxID=37927 RepID=A0A126ZW93_9MICC|nr:hypothetical protein [Sinomonas atrocyanea]AMM31363.1 hypothetical protein SA2016_0673 [Sinomonas atrocyanea]GEB64451.1 hypothetical protein SAT01_18990 [Sinomonas atrocyanea]GGG62792.1 hypothetical protein GCM10007172_12470 [Sinomonas atrocyanea]
MTPPRHTRPAPVRAFLEYVLWTAVGTLFWLATASTVTAVETGIAAAVSLVCAVLARLARRALPFRARPGREWLRWAAVVPLAACADLLRLPGWLRSGQPEQLREAAMPTGGDRQTGWRAGGIVALSATPGSVVVASDPDSGAVTVHSVTSGWPRLDEQVLRDKEPGR